MLLNPADIFDKKVSKVVLEVAALDFSFCDSDSLCFLIAAVPRYEIKYVTLHKVKFDQLFIGIRS